MTCETCQGTKYVETGKSERLFGFAQLVDVVRACPDCKARPILAWGRPLGYETGLHAIVDLGIDLGSVGSMVTLCNGRWQHEEPAEIYYGDEKSASMPDFCDRCVIVAALTGVEEHG